MKKPLIMYQGGEDHLEHMIARLDAIDDELLDFERVIKWQPAGLRDSFYKARVEVQKIRGALKERRERIKAKAAFR